MVSETIKSNPETMLDRLHPICYDRAIRIQQQGMKLMEEFNSHKPQR